MAQRRRRQCRKGPGKDKRGNTRDRAIRHLWLLAAFGDGYSCPCRYCGTTLTFETVEADRVVPGGSYRRENIVPACRSCNSRRGNDPHWVGPNPHLRVMPDISLKVCPLRYAEVRGLPLAT